MGALHLPGPPVTHSLTMPIPSSRETKLLEDIEDARCRNATHDMQRLKGELRSLHNLEYRTAMKRSSTVQSEQAYAGYAGTSSNRFGHDPILPPHEQGFHIPVLALINPTSGGGAGGDILAVARACPYYKERFFNIIDIVKGQRPGGALDMFRIELNMCKDEAKAMGSRARIIAGGGDGTASFALFVIFLALRAQPGRERIGLADSGNGFIWTDEELAESFPALAQMPLGSANDCAHILGWGQKCPGDVGPVLNQCLSASFKAARLVTWISHVVSPTTRISNFDVWGMLPKPGDENCDYKLAELTGKQGLCPNRKLEGERQIVLKPAGKPVPFFVCLYFTAGFGAYMVSRFQINRRRTPLRNRLEYTKQAVGIILEKTPPQLFVRLDGVEVDCDGDPYFPPRRDAGNRGRCYREVGFYNINWQANAVHGADRAGCGARLCSTRPPVRFNDGQMDMFRWHFKSLLKNPGLRVQTDKKKEMLMRFNGGKGKGVFFQFDGEARFAFNPSGDPFHIFIRQVLQIPVVIGPEVDTRLTGPLDDPLQVRFSFVGKDAAEVQHVKSRLLDLVSGQLDEHVNASEAELDDAGFLRAETRDALHKAISRQEPAAAA